MSASDYVVVDRVELERLQRSARAWKRSAKQWKRAFRLQTEFKEYWYRSYRLAWQLDEPSVGEVVVSWWRRLFGAKESDT